MQNNNAGHAKHLATLDALRGIAALVVLVFHIRDLVHLPFLMPHADMAVDFFFMLSGFVIARAYETKLLTNMSFPRFVIVRLARLYPMIFISVLMGGFVLAIRMMTTHTLTAGQLLTAVACALVMLPTSALSLLLPDALFPVNPPLWSLFFEFVVNFAYAPIVRWLTNKRLIAICVISGLGLGWAAFVHQGLAFGWGPSTFFITFLRVTFPFAYGVLIYRCAPRRQWPGWFSAVLMLALAVVLMVPYFQNEWLYEMTVLTLIFPPIVICGAGCRNGFIMNGVCLALGELSYPLYLVHHSVLRITTNAVQILHLNMKMWPLAGLCFFTSVLAASAILRLWDMPLRSWLGRAARKSKQPVPPVSISPTISGY